MKRILFLILCIVFLSSSLYSQTPPAKELPRCTFSKLDGTFFSTSEIPQGRIALFSFFDVTCSHCQRAMQTFNQQHANLGKVPVFLVSLDEKEAIQTFMEKYGKDLLKMENVMVLQDSKYEFIPAFHPVRYPSVFLYNKNRKLELYESNDENILSIILKAKKLAL